MDFGFGRAALVVVCATTVLVPHTRPVPVPEQVAREVIVVSRMTESENRVLQLLAERRGATLAINATYMAAADKRAAQVVTHFCHCATPEVPNDWGEVLAWHAGIDPVWVVNAWMASPTHRQVIMMSRWDRVGIGSVLSGGNWYVVVLFGDGTNQ